MPVVMTENSTDNTTPNTDLLELRDFTSMSHDAFTYSSSELADISRRMEAKKDALQRDIATSTSTRKTKMAKIFEMLKVVNPTEANRSFSDFDDDSKSFRERMDGCKLRMVSKS